MHQELYEITNSGKNNYYLRMEEVLYSTAL
jgi:hypothetical protein